MVLAMYNSIIIMPGGRLKLWYIFWKTDLSYKSWFLSLNQ